MADRESPEWRRGRLRKADAQQESELNDLAGLSPIEYGQQREAAAERLGTSLKYLDDEIKHRRKRLARESVATTEAPVDIDKLARSAREIIDSRDVLGLFVSDFSRQIAGEEKLGKLLYLACTSRLFDKAMHIAIKGTSSGGKSEVRKCVVGYMPPEHVASFTTLSEKALLYVADDFAHKVLSMGEAAGIDERKLQDYLLRELISEGTLRYPVVHKDPDTGLMATTVIEKHGPVCFVVTTTRNELNPENETRMLSLEIDDSEEQTRAVLHKVAEVVGYNKVLRPKRLAIWHDYQRWLAADDCDVVVPFAKTLARLIPPKSTRLRRDFAQVLQGIKAHALLHREHRKRDKDGCIRATVKDDYAAIAALMSDLLAVSSEVKMREALAATVKVVQERQGDDDEHGVLTRVIADALKLDPTTAWRRLRAAEDRGFLVNLETRPRRPGRYRTTGQELKQVEMLPTPAALVKELRR
jgi:hypothetical protein